MNPADPVEAESYRILRSRPELSALPPLSRAGTERVIYATADFDHVTDLVRDEGALAAGAVRSGGWPALGNVSEKGGPAVATAAFDALLRVARNPGEEAHG